MPNSPISDLNKCPNRVQKQGYSPDVNGCGSTYTQYVVPDNPMFFFATISHDSDYLQLHPNNNDGDFNQACNDHDIGYGTCDRDKSVTDSKFQADMIAVCRRDYIGIENEEYLDQCLEYADAYYDAVANWGRGAYEDGQKDSCNCCFQ